MNLTPEQLKAIMPYAGPHADECAGPLNAAMARFGINTPARMAHFLPQVAHESAQLACTRENLNYSAAALMRTWPKRFLTIEHAKGFAHMPEQIANFVYANRNGNGDVVSGDGWRYRGAGFIQLTFKANQQACANQFGVSSDIGDWLASPTGAALSAAWFWSEHGCNELADKGDVDAISDIINLGHHTPAIGDAIGYADRLSLTRHAIEVLA